MNLKDVEIDEIPRSEEREELEWVEEARGESLFDEFLDSKVKKSRDGRPRGALTQDWETELNKTLSIWQLP